MIWLNSWSSIIHVFYPKELFMRVNMTQVFLMNAFWIILLTDLNSEKANQSSDCLISDTLVLNLSSSLKLLIILYLIRIPSIILIYLLFIQCPELITVLKLQLNLWIFIITDLKHSSSIYQLFLQIT